MNVKPTPRFGLEDLIHCVNHVKEFGSILGYPQPMFDVAILFELLNGFRHVCADTLVEPHQKIPQVIFRQFAGILFNYVGELSALHETPTYMLQLENLEKILVKNWTSYIDVHLLTGFVREFVQKTEFVKADVPDGISYHKDGVRIKVTSVRLVTDCAEIIVHFSAPKEGAVVIGEMELSIRPGDVTITTYYGRLVNVGS